MNHGFIDKSFRIIGIICFLALLSPVLLPAQEISIQELKKDIYYLASDSLQGRKSGTIQGNMAARYLRSRYGQAKLKPLYDNGLQPFNIVVKVALGKRNSLSFPGFEGKPGQDYTPFSFSESVVLDAPVVFAGYGFDINKDSLQWNDYSGVDVKGKWVMMLRGNPEPDKSDSKFIPYSDDRAKVLHAKDKGAAGVILVSGVDFEKNDTLVNLKGDQTEATAELPVLNLKRSVTDKLLKEKGVTIEELEKKMNKERKPGSFTMVTRVNATTQVTHLPALTYNVVFMMEGSDSTLKKEYIVLGGHYDHLGWGGPESGSRTPDTIAIHHGADDNASGAAGVVALATRFAAMKTKPKRSIIFVNFTGEELGLLGSKYFTKHPPVALKNIDAMFNIDMIGRLNRDSGSVVVSGTGTSAEAEGILDKEKQGRGFPVKYSPEGYGASDHSSFYVENIPVFFFTTGAHEDYHTPFDVAEKINYEGEKDVLDFVYDLMLDVANRDKPLSFKESGPKTEGRYGAKFKVTLGILPDMAATDNKGLRVDGLRKDGPAAKAGVKKGDVIVAINGKPLKNIYEYMDRLKEIEKGQLVNIDVMRGDKLVVLLVQF